MSSLPRDPAWFFEGKRRAEAVGALKKYFADYTGSWFEKLADADHPNEITARDIVAVTTLGVTIPPATSIWLLGEGQAAVTSLLKKVPMDQPIWHPKADLTTGGAAWRLWNVIKAGGWGSHHGGMGQTKTSKLMATKRSHLVPIHDSYIREALFTGGVSNYWAPWQRWLPTPDGGSLRRLAEEVRTECGVGDDLSTLRIIDIVIWMWIKKHRH